jgi:transposase
MVKEHQEEYQSQYQAICSIATKIDCTGETFGIWLCQAERD